MKKRLKYLNLYPGVGGNINLLDENEVEITNVELNPKIAEILQERKPNQRVIVADAHQYLLDHFEEYDFVWASRPCQSHTRMVKFTRHRVRKYPDFGLYEEIVFLDHFFKGRWVVENVVPYYDPLIKPTARLGRHFFWANFEISQFNIPTPPNFINLATTESKRVMMDWLGIHYEKNIYYGKNHCPVQILRNCVHPLLGKHVFECSKAVQQAMQL